MVHERFNVNDGGEWSVPSSMDRQLRVPDDFVCSSNSCLCETSGVYSAKPKNVSRPFDRNSISLNRIKLHIDWNMYEANHVFPFCLIYPAQRSAG